MLLTLSIISWAMRWLFDMGMAVWLAIFSCTSFSSEIAFWLEAENLLCDEFITPALYTFESILSASFSNRFRNISSAFFWYSSIFFFCASVSAPDESVGSIPNSVVGSMPSSRKSSVLGCGAGLIYSISFCSGTMLKYAPTMMAVAAAAVSSVTACRLKAASLFRAFSMFLTES